MGMIAEEFDFTAEKVENQLERELFKTTEQRIEDFNSFKANIPMKDPSKNDVF